MAVDDLYRLPPGGRLRAAGLYPVWVVGMWSSVVLSIWAATQWLAHQWSYAPSLGPAWWTIWQWKLYAPWQGAVWWWWFRTVPHLDPLWRGAIDVMVWTLVSSACGLSLVVLRRARSVGGPSDLHGSAHWAQKKDVQNAGLLDGTGVYLGAWQSKRTRHYLQHGGPENVLLVAPPRKGKGVSSIIPTALTWPHSLIIHDPKGEAWHMTNGFRRHALGHACLRFDPTCSDDTGAHCNPLLEIRPWPYDVRDALTIAEALIERELLTSTKEGKHWDDTASQFLVALLLHVLYAEPDKSLVGCLHVMTNPYRTLAQTLEVMRTTHHDEHNIYHWIDPWTGQETRTHPVVASAVRAVENKSAKERDSVISSAVAHFTLYYDSIIAGNIQDSSFALADVLDPQQRVSLYLTTPSSDVDHVMPLLRIIINLALRRMTEKMEDPTRGWARSDVWRLLLLLDEFPQLGRIPTLQTKLSVLASYGVKTFLVAQDLEQIYEKYGIHESITSTCDVQTYFAPNKLATAEWISKRIGHRTVHREQRTYTGPRFAMYLPHMIASEGESQRPLLAPDEIMRLPVGSDTDPRDPGEAVILVTGHPPIRGKKMRFYQDRDFSQRTDPTQYPPLPASDHIDHDWSLWTDHVAVLGTASAVQPSSTPAVPPPAAAAPPRVVVSPPPDEPLY